MSNRNRYQKKSLRETRRPTGHIPQSKHMYNLSSDDDDDNNTLKRIQQFDKLFSGGIYSSDDDEDYDLECNNHESEKSNKSDVEKSIEKTEKPEINTTPICVNIIKENDINPEIIKEKKEKKKVIINDKRTEDENEDENISDEVTKLDENDEHSIAL